MRNALLALLITLAPSAACGPKTPPSPPPGEPTVDAASQGGKTCNAGPTECCQPDGTIVKATCDPLDNGPARGEGGWCKQCTLRCLPPTALIATPDGERAISTLRAGDAIWTLDAAGRRVSRPIVRIRALPAAAHTVLHFTLADGRTLTASPGHPTADARALSALLPGDHLDGSTIVSITPTPLDGAATWDLLPAPYWANSILLSSTLDLDPRTPENENENVERERSR